MNKQNATVDSYLAQGCMRCKLGGTPECKVHNWPEELVQLRRIINACGLTEEVKWGVPCYTSGGKNIAIMSAFKEYASLSFFKGALLKDSEQILDKPGKNTQAARLIKFTDVETILKMEPVLKAYIREAVEVEEKGLKVETKKSTELEIPEEFQAIMDEMPELQEAFDGLTPGRQRGYVLHFAQPKQSKTRTARVEKCIPKILEGKGFFDR